MFDVFQSHKVNATSNIHPNSRNSVQMLDSESLNNIFFRAFVSNCDESYPTETMALELRGGPRIYTSDADSIGQFELAVP